ncbi:MAG: hypothetical protein JWN65_1962 [Solirubrobacterales bacterium]|nr:hypothetical protein [Solirubrobacterales bacterium]
MTTYADEILEQFSCLAEARVLIEDWRPHAVVEGLHVGVLPRGAGVEGADHARAMLGEARRADRVYRKLSAGIKRAVERAFSRAYARRIPVTMTLAGSVARGSGAPVAMGISTFTMKRKPPGGTAYRIEPSIGIGPDGPVAGGLTRPKSDADFRSVATPRQGCTGDADCDGTPDSSDACPSQGG